MHEKMFLDNQKISFESQIDPWRKQYLSVENYGLLRAAEEPSSVRYKIESALSPFSTAEISP